MAHVLQVFRRKWFGNLERLPIAIGHLNYGQFTA